MAPPFHFLSLLPSLIIILTATSHPTTATTSSYLPPTQQPTPNPPPPYNLSTLLTTLGFHTLSAAAAATSFTPNTTTIFSPTDASLRSCPYCSLPLLLLEHSLPALYPFHLLSTLTFATKIQTLASTPSTPLCLTLTKSKPSTSSTPPTLFVGGVEITRPDLFNDGRLIIHGIQGYLTHLSPFSCQIDRLTSLSFPSRPVYAPTSTAAMHAMLTQAMHDLRTHAYTVLALLIQENLDMLLKLNCMTIFAVNDAGVFGDGNRFVSSFRFHIVPGKRLTGLELISLPTGSALPTMVAGEGLVVTVAGGGGPLVPMRVNNVRVMRTNIVLNEGVVVHRIARPFRRVHRIGAGYWPDETEGGITDGR